MPVPGQPAPVGGHHPMSPPSSHHSMSPHSMSPPVGHQMSQGSVPPGNHPMSQPGGHMPQQQVNQMSLSQVSGF